jgi:hypothetical protein
MEPLDTKRQSFCNVLCFPFRTVKSAQIGLFCKLLASVYPHDLHAVSTPS